MATLEEQRTEKELLGSDYVEAKNELQKQTTQMGGGFYQISQRSDFEDRYPNAINEFVLTDSVKEIAAKAEVTTDQLKPPYAISDETITAISEILDFADPLNLSDAELIKLRSDVDNILNDIEIPTADEIIAWVSTYKKFVSSATDENISFPTNTREIPLVSTDVSIDSFLERTGIRKLVTIRLNQLVYPYITPRYHIPSDLQGTLVDAVGAKDDVTITFSDINKEVGVSEIVAGSRILITNNAKDIIDLAQQKVLVEWISEESKTIRLKTPLLFELDSSHVVQIYQYTSDDVLSPGDIIKIPK